MKDIFPDSDNKVNNEPLIKKDKSLLWMSVILGMIILIMGYLTFFVEEPLKIFEKKEKVETVIDDQNQLLGESKGMNDEDVLKSLTKFIEAFYYDQKRGYFDPPSYFAAITETFFNYHNLTYKELKELYWKRKEEMQDLRRVWIVSSLDFSRNDSRITATYWAKESFFRPSLREKRTMDIKYEMVIDEKGKIVSYKSTDIKNLDVVKLPPDTTALLDSAINANAGVPGGASAGNQIYDYSVVDVVPEFQGGQKEWAKFLSSNLKYPVRAREKNTQGKVYVAFIVEKDGSIKDVKIKQGIGDGCDEEAVRVIRTSPAWKPGQVKGAVVSTYCVVPISFQLVN
jgi:TonB family protein